MADKTTTIPLPPEFPASNASYSGIAKRMHELASEAPTREVAIQVTDYLRCQMKGVNTYAKRVRDYADSILAALVAAEPRVFKTMPAAKTALTKAGIDPATAIIVEVEGGFRPTLTAKGEARRTALLAGFAVVEG